MKEAQSLGMTNGRYAFITLDLNTDVFYKDGQWTGNQGSGSEFPDELTGIIDLSVYRPDLSEEFKMAYKNKEDALEPAIKTKLYHKVCHCRHIPYCHSMKWSPVLPLSCMVN